MTPRTLEGIVVFTLLAGGSTAQQVNQPSAVTPQDSRKDAAAGTLRGQVADESGAVIPEATVTLTNFAGVAKTLKTGPDGTFSVPGLPPGRYTVRAFATGMTLYENTAVEIGAGETPMLRITMKVGLEKQQITVQDQPGTTVNTDPAYNVGALILKGDDLDALPDDPDDLEADLQALAGPAAGPNGGQIFIDGFTGGRLPPKQSIREIRINQNPFSAEFDRLGYGRIEIFTKPGSDKFHGSSYFNFGDDILNSRNPYAPNKPPFQARMYGGNLSGPLISKRASFFLDIERRELDDNAIINATILNPSFNIIPFSEGIVTPQRRATFSPRFDYQLSQNNTLTGRYSYTRVGQDNAGIGQFSLLSRAYNTLSNEQTVQLTETTVLNARAINETRFQFIRHHLNDFGATSIPSINVLEAFNGGGSQVGQAANLQDRWELQNYTSLTRGTHALKFGVRVRAVDSNDFSPQNFGGSFTFSGGFAPVLSADNQIVSGPDGKPEIAQISSIERYRRTLLFENQGLPAVEIRRLGGGPSQFTIAAGNPQASVTQADMGLFLQDDWRMRPNLTLSLGMRYETQTNIHDWRDLGPRIGFGWAPGTRGNRPGKTVIRGGFGTFYDRFSESLVLQAERFNGINQQQIIVQNPDFYPVVPPVETLNGKRITQSIREIGKDLRAPYILQTAIGIERQLPRNTTFAVTYTNSRAVHLLRSRDINAPLPGTFSAAGSGVRPYGEVGEIFEYESNGILNQNMMIANLNSRLSRNFSLFTNYRLNFAKSDTDGAGTSPANPYDLRTEYGRAAIDSRHWFALGGSFLFKGGFRLSPFVIARSGGPFNITTGRDANGDSVFNDRPAFATDLTKSNIIQTRYGNFDPNPSSGEVLIPRNDANGPGLFTVNLRLGRTFGFGPTRAAAANSGEPSGGRGGGGARGGRGGGGGGGMRMGGGGGGGFRGGGGEGTTSRRYNLTLSISARNLLNHTNPGPPIGNLTSPLFGLSNSLAGGFGPAASAGNRRIDLQLRFTF